MIDAFIAAVDQMAAAILPRRRWVLLIEKGPGKYTVAGRCGDRSGACQIVRDVHKQHVAQGEPS